MQTRKGMASVPEPLLTYNRHFTFRRKTIIETGCEPASKGQQACPGKRRQKNKAAQILCPLLVCVVWELKEDL